MKTAGDSPDALESPWGGSRGAPVRLLRRPKGSRESPGKLQGGSREAFATPPVVPRSLPSGSREAFGRRQTQSRHFGGFQGGPGATRGPQEPPKNPSKRPLWDPLESREAPKSTSKPVPAGSAGQKQKFRKCARRLSGKHILTRFGAFRLQKNCFQIVTKAV